MVPENTILVSIDVANIPQDEEINIVFNANTKHSTETNLKPYMTTAMSAQTYRREELLPTYWKKTTYKYMELPRAPKWQLLFQIFSWLRWKQRS